MIEIVFQKRKKKITRTKKTWKNNFTIQRDKNHPTQDQIVVEINGKLKAVEIWTKQKLLVAFYLICIEVFFFLKKQIPNKLQKVRPKKIESLFNISKSIHGGHLFFHFLLLIYIYTL